MESRKLLSFNKAEPKKKIPDSKLRIRILISNPTETLLNRKNFAILQ